MSRIKVILWDVDGTLLNFQEAEKCAIRACFERFDMGICTDEMLAVYSEINRGYWERLERGEISKLEVLEGRFRDFFTAFGMPTEQVPKFNREYQLSLGDTICFEPGAPELVRALQGNYLQCAVTNGTRVAQEKKLKRSGLDQIFDHIFISDLVGYEKPAPEFFDAVRTKIGNYEKDEVLIVGDSLTSDMRGGNQAGILTCWYNPKGLANTQNVLVDYEIRHLEQVWEILNVGKNARGDLEEKTLQEL